jgi:hypothetical protein
MAGNTLNTASTLQCPHGATVQVVSSNTKVSAGGGAAALANDTFTIVGCPFQLPTTPPTPSPCVKVQWLATDGRVKVGGAATLSQTSSGLCLSAAQVPQGPVVILATQSKVTSQ